MPEALKASFILNNGLLWDCFLLGHRSSPVQFEDLDFKKQGYAKWVAYGQSKTANIYMANEIERRYGSQGLFPPQ